MTYQNLLLELEGPLATLTINRPQALNALNPTTLKELESAVSALIENPQVKVIIFTGSGAKAFVAGGDIAVMQGLGPLEARAVARQAQKLFNLIEQAPKISLAAINGYALGGGCELAMACDFRIAANSARFGQPEINLGILPGWGGTQRLARLVGKAKAKEMMLTGDMINAAEAQRLGLVNQMVEAEQLMAVTRALAEKIASKPQIAARLIKEAVDKGLEMPVDRAMDYEAELFGLCFATQDQKEGMQAFLEKRPAIWHDA